MGDHCRRKARLHPPGGALRRCVLSPSPHRQPGASLTRRGPAHTFTEMNAISKGVSIGIMQRSANETGVGPSQPYVELMGRKVGPFFPLLSPRRSRVGVGAGHRDARRRMAGLVEGPGGRPGESVRIRLESVQATDGQRHGRAPPARRLVRPRRAQRRPSPSRLCTGQHEAHMRVEGNRKGTGSTSRSVRR